MNEETKLVISSLSHNDDFVNSIRSVIDTYTHYNKESILLFVASSIYDMLDYEVASSLEEASDITVQLAMLSFNRVNFNDIANYFIGEYERQR